MTRQWTSLCDPRLGLRKLCLIGATGGKLPPARPGTGSPNLITVLIRLAPSGTRRRPGTMRLKASRLIWFSVPYGYHLHWRPHLALLS